MKIGKVRLYEKHAIYFSMCVLGKSKSDIYMKREKTIKRRQRKRE